MEYNYYRYTKPECGVIINKMPIWYKEVEYSGDKIQGSITLQTQHEHDEIWGPESIMEINWEKKDRLKFFYYKEVQISIDMYNAVGIVVTEKNKDWLRSHEITFWSGHRNKMIRKRFYSEKVMHCIFYCDITETLFNVHTSIIGDRYENFKPFILKSFNSIECH
ncbi:MAG: hypothetical protein ACFFDY_09410 [Candidatus Thorarchaeota archaeon]